MQNRTADSFCQKISITSISKNSVKIERVAQRKKGGAAAGEVIPSPASCLFPSSASFEKMPESAAVIMWSRYCNHAVMIIQL